VTEALRVRDLYVTYPTKHGPLHAVAGVAFDAAKGETVGLVGESGCGKSSTGRAILQLPPPSSGSVQLDGVELTAIRGATLRAARTRIQMIFQDPISCLNPRRTARELVEHPLALWGKGSRVARRERVDELLSEVGIDPGQLGDRYSWELSGGQCQRVNIARAMALDPEVLVCDEPVSALDVSVQAQVLNLLTRIQRDRHLTMLFIAHDLAVVKNVSDKICVMYLGKVCEVAPADKLYERPAHHYTRALIDSVPMPDPSAPAGRSTLAGEIPSPLSPPSGCRFRTRCPAATERCAQQEPQLRQVDDGHIVACHHPLTDVPADAGLDVGAQP
jgi:peptide/nickel transport system ATP-binding protein